MKKKLLLCSVLFVFASSAFANDSINVSGFATIAGGYIDDNTVGANSISKTPGHAGYSSEKIEFQPDSLAAIQISSRLTDDMSVTVQMIGRFSDEEAEVNLEWAYINYDLFDGVTVQAGRFRPAVYLYSNTLDIGFSYLWIAPPSEVYSQVPMTYTDGLNLLFSHTFENDMTLEASIYASNVNTDLSVSGQKIPFKFNNLIGTEFTLGNDYFKLRAGYAKTELNAELSTLGINDTLPVSIFQALNLQDASGTFSSLGITVDYKNIIFIGEYAARIIEDSVFTEETASYYTTLGYRMGSLTPHVTYSAIENTYNKSSLITGAGAIVDATVNGQINAARSAQATDSNTLTVGMRYDLNPRACLKFEYQKINKTPQDVQLVPFEQETDANLYNVALNVIF